MNNVQTAQFAYGLSIFCRFPDMKLTSVYGCHVICVSLTLDEIDLIKNQLEKIPFWEYDERNNVWKFDVASQY